MPLSDTERLGADRISTPRPGVDSSSTGVEPGAEPLTNAERLGADRVSAERTGAGSFSPEVAGETEPFVDPARWSDRRTGVNRTGADALGLEVDGETGPLLRGVEPTGGRVSATEAGDADPRSGAGGMIGGDSGTSGIATSGSVNGPRAISSSSASSSGSSTVGLALTTAGSGAMSGSGVSKRTVTVVPFARTRYVAS